MIDTKQYLIIKRHSYPLSRGANEIIQIYNKILVNKYPWLLPRNRWTGNVVKDYDYSYSELDDMPDGWRIAFGDQMCEELNNELVKFNYQDKYRILQIKEKYGELRWYDNGYPVGNLSEDYEEIHSIEWKYPKCKKDEYVRFIKQENNLYIFHKYRLLERSNIADILSKYQILSVKTCICCGAPATWISSGWISPYCDDCIDNKDYATKIEDYKE